MQQNILIKNLDEISTGHISIKKPIPALVEHNLIKHIAKINNIDINTGLEISGPPSEFQLLLIEVKDFFFRFIRNNLLLIILLLFVIIGLYYRYHTVKNKKKQSKYSKHKYL